MQFTIYFYFILFFQNNFVLDLTMLSSLIVLYRFLAFIILLVKTKLSKCQSSNPSLTRCPLLLQNGKLEVRTTIANPRSKIKCWRTIYRYFSLVLIIVKHQTVENGLIIFYERNAVFKLIMPILSFLLCRRRQLTTTSRCMKT